MKERFLNITISYITRYQHYNDADIENLRYGLEGLYLTFTKLVLILLLAFILGIQKQLLILLVLFNIIRFTGFGFHARTSLECLVCSTILFVGLPLLFSKLNLSSDKLLIIGLASLIILAIYAPADTVKRPLPNKKKRILRKTSTIVIACTFIILSYISKNYDLSYLFISALVLEAIMVSPIMYKIFRQPYKNYKKYN